MTVYGSTSYTPRAIDLDLFVNAASRGFQDGAKVPTPFASFVGSFFQGLDDSAKYQGQLQQNEIRQTQIDEGVPEAESQITKAKAVEATARSEAIQENPEAFKSTIINDFKSDAAKKEADAIINQKKIDLITIMDGSDGAAKGEALTSGKFDSIITKQQKEEYIANTFKDWAPETAKLYEETQKINQNREWTAAAREIAVKSYPKDIEDVTGNGDIQTIQTAIGGNVSIPELLTKGKIVTVQINALGKQVTPEEIKQGGEKIISLTPRKIFMYEDKPYDIGGISADTFNVFSKAKTNYNIVNGNSKYAGGASLGDLQESRRQQQEINAKSSAEATLQYEEDAARARTAQDAFNAGSRINPPYQEAARTVQERIKEGKKAPTPEAGSNDYTVSMTPPVVTPVPEVKHLETATPVATPSIRPEGTKVPEILNTPVSTSVSTPEAVVTPGWTVTPGTASPTTLATPTNQSSAMPAPSQVGSPQAQETELKKNLIKSKALEKVSKYQETNAPIPSTPTPVDQAKQVAASSYVPSQFKMNVSYAPNEEGVRKVANSPYTQGFSALTKAVMAQESAGNIDAVSPTGVLGIAQLTGDTAKDISPDIDVKNPVENALGGAIYLEKLLNTPAFENNPMLALTSYNAGPGVVAKAIQLAGSTEWNRVKNFIEPAVLSFKWDKRIDPKRKAIEARQYAEKVVANFPSFVSTRSDMAIADKLKSQGILGFDNIPLSGA